MLASAVQWTESSVWIHISPHLGFPSRWGHHRALREFLALYGRFSLWKEFKWKCKHWWFPLMTYMVLTSIIQVKIILPLSCFKTWLLIIRNRSSCLRNFLPQHNKAELVDWVCGKCLGFTWGIWFIIQLGVLVTSWIVLWGKSHGK